MKAVVPLALLLACAGAASATPRLRALLQAAAPPLPTKEQILSASQANTTAAIAPVAADLAAAYLSGGANASSATRVVGDALAEPGECFLGTVTNNTLPVTWNALQGALATALKATAACANATALADFLRATTSPTPPALNTVGQSLNATGPPPTQQQIIDTANNGSTSDIIALAQASVAAMVAGQTAQQVQTLAGALDATGCLTGPVANKILPAIYTTLIEKFNYDVFAASVVCPGSRGFFINNLINYGIVNNYDLTTSINYPPLPFLPGIIGGIPGGGAAAAAVGGAGGGAAAAAVGK